MKNISLILLFLMLLSACKFELPADKTLKTCQLPTSISATVDATNLLKNSYNLSGTTTDIKSVTWKVFSGATLLAQSSLSPTATYYYTFSTAGNYSVTADIVTTCNTTKTLNYTAGITCTLPNNITYSADASIKHKYNFSLTSNKIADVSSVTWKVMNGTTLVSQSTTSGSQVFSYTTISSGTYTVTAEVQTICGLKTTFSQNITDIYSCLLTQQANTNVSNSISTTTTNLYQYNNIDSLVSIKNSSGTVLKQMTYTISNSGVVKIITYNNVTETYTYDLKGYLLKFVKYSDLSNGQYVRETYTYTYNQLNKLIQKDLVVIGSSITGWLNINQKITYEYNSNNLLVKVTATNYSPSVTTYEYDNLNNNVKISNSSGTITLNEFNASRLVVKSSNLTNANQLLSYTTYTYDSNNNIIKQSTYDSSNKLTNEINNTYSQCK